MDPTIDEETLRTESALMNALMLLMQEVELETGKPDTIIGKAHKKAIVSLTEEIGTCTYLQVDRRTKERLKTR